jgi:hypothetical protein
VAVELSLSVLGRCERLVLAGTAANSEPSLLLFLGVVKSTGSASVRPPWRLRGGNRLRAQRLGIPIDAPQRERTRFELPGADQAFHLLSLSISSRRYLSCSAGSRAARPHLTRSALPPLAMREFLAI